MAVVAIVLVACAVALLVGAEWSSVAGRMERERPTRRRRRRGRGDLTLVEDEVESGVGDRDAFERSVAQDLENLPVLGDPDDRSRR